MFIKELEANPDLAKNENVFKELGGDIYQKVKGQLLSTVDGHFRISLQKAVVHKTLKK